jgi:YfiH family protein
MSTSLLLQHALRPDWPAIAGVQALFTTRAGGVSRAPFDRLNLGDHVNDCADDVQCNRERLSHAISTLAEQPTVPVFMQQVHGVQVQTLHRDALHAQPFDACISQDIGVACTVMVADCLPILWAHRSGAAVAASHAGWRGLLGSQGQGVVESTWSALAQQLNVPANADFARELQVWLGPCIGPQQFEVGPEVRDAFVAQSPCATSFFAACAKGKWLADLPGLARWPFTAMMAAPLGAPSAIRQDFSRTGAMPAALVVRGVWPLVFGVSEGTSCNASRWTVSEAACSA